MADDNNQPDPFDILKWFFGPDIGDQFNQSAEPANDDVPAQAPAKAVPAVISSKVGNAQYFQI